MFYIWVISGFDCENTENPPLPRSACWRAHGTPVHIPLLLSRCHSWQLQSGPGVEHWSPGKSQRHGPLLLYAAVKLEIERKMKRHY